MKKLLGIGLLGLVVLASSALISAPAQAFDNYHPRHNMTWKKPNWERRHTFKHYKLGRSGRIHYDRRHR